MFTCECGKSFEKSQAYNGHCAHCIEHLKDSPEKLRIAQERDRKALELAREHLQASRFQKAKDSNDLWVSENHICEHCGKVMSIKYASGRFCSSRCSHAWVALHQSDDAVARKILHLKPGTSASRPWTLEQKKAASDRTKALMANPEIRKKISDKAKGRKFSDATKKKLSDSAKYRHITGSLKSWSPRGTESSYEILWRSILDNLKIPYTQEYIIPKKSLNSGIGYYAADFYIEGKSLDIEIDGKQHCYEERSAHDRERDANLEAAGYIVYRIDHEDLKPENLPSTIKKFLEFYGTL